VVHPTSSPSTKRNIMFVTNQVVGLAGIFQTNTIRLIIDFVAKAGIYYQKILP
jgi:hypothetical protein